MSSSRSKATLSDYHLSEKREKQISKFLSKVLRQKPELIRIELSKEGWVEIETLLTAMKTYANFPVTRQELDFIVAHNDKQRFAYDIDGHDVDDDDVSVEQQQKDMKKATKIRANQGHSISIINLQLCPVCPPETLYHGTSRESLFAIQESGLVKMSRNFIHLSSDIETAKIVGRRKISSQHNLGQVVVLVIRSLEMHQKGLIFFCSKNGVWFDRPCTLRVY